MTDLVVQSAFEQRQQLLSSSFNTEIVAHNGTVLTESLLYQHWVHLFLLSDFSRDLITHSESD